MSLYLVGIDGSSGGERALEAAADLAQRSGAELLITYVIAWSPFSFSTPEENAERHRRREQELSIAREKLLEPVSRRLTEQGIKLQVSVTHGHPARTLLNLADQHQASMIIIGRSGDTPLKTRFFGGTAAALTQSATCPVVIVP